MYPVVFTQSARAELIDAQDWYQNEAPGLGSHFLAAANEAIQRISANPRQFPLVYKSIRRVLLRRFPYALLFVTESNDTLTVLACFHGSRNPAHWQKRV